MYDDKKKRESGGIEAGIKTHSPWLSVPFFPAVGSGGSGISY